jgi:hypothetical protein
MAFLVEQDIALDPFLVGLFGPIGIVFEADDVADLIEDFLPRAGCEVMFDMLT